MPIVDGPDAELVRRALARPGLRDELLDLGVRDVTGFGASQVYVPDERESYVRELIDQAFANETPTTRRRRPRHREPDELLTETVLACGAKVEERLAAMKRLGPGRRVPQELTQEAIALDFGFSRDRVRQIEALIEVGWPLGKSHPDFSPKREYVMLPSVDEATSLLASG
jgi:hypothetical protein